MTNVSIEQVKRIPLFTELSQRDLRAIARLVERGHYRAGTVICNQGEIGSTAYFVESGTLRVLRVDPQGVEREVARFGPGDYFGETSLLLGEPRDATVEVVEDANLLYLNKGDFDQLLDERPRIFDGLQLSSKVERKRRAPRFKWQTEGEVVVVSLHKHNVTLIIDLILPGLALFSILFIWGYLTISGNTKIWIHVLSAFFAMIPVLISLYFTVDHFNDDYILTNRRVVHEERVFLMREMRTEAPLRTIQNAQQLQEGALARLFDLGDLIIETAGEHGVVVFRQIAQPEKIQDDIFEQIDRAQSWARAEERAAVRDALQQRFGDAEPDQPVLEPQSSSTQKRFPLAPPAWLKDAWWTIRQVVPSLRYEEGDTITWRKHWIALIKKSWTPSLLILGITGITIWGSITGRSSFVPIMFTYGTVLFFLLPWWVWVFADWRNDVYQVTSSRIIDVEQQPLALREERREASLGMIQNISLRIPSLVGRVLNYGSVTIETAGAGAFTFDYVKDPRGVQSTIFSRMQAFQQRQRQQEAERRRNELLDWFSVYDQLRNPQASEGWPANQPARPAYQKKES